MKYFHLKTEDELPALAVGKPFKAVVIIEQSVSSNWQANVSRWLVASGCGLHDGVGIDCSSWDDAVDQADLERHDYRGIPASEFIMTHGTEMNRCKKSFASPSTMLGTKSMT